jgi:hypothetical protein
VFNLKSIMNLKGKIKESNLNELCNHCSSMTATDEGLKNLSSKGVIRKCSDLIKGSNLSCPCCAFLLTILDHKNLPKGETAFVTITRQTGKATDDQAVAFHPSNDPSNSRWLWAGPVRLWADLYSSPGSRRLASCYWDAYAPEGKSLNPPSIIR